MLSYKVNEYITLKLENKNTQIYVKNRKFRQCIRLVLNIPTDEFNEYDNINSIDEAADVYKRKTIHQNRIIHERGARNLNQNYNITPEQEFWGHCSNLQTWVENKYDTRLLHSNLSFPLLKELYIVGDPNAKKVFKEEIAIRLESAAPNIIEFLFKEKYLDYLSSDEIKSVIESLSFCENLLINIEPSRTLQLIDNLLFKLAPHYRQRQVSGGGYNISPRIIKYFAESIYNLFKKGHLNHLGERLMNRSCLGIIINYFEKIREHSKVIEICQIILSRDPQLPEIWNALGYSLTLAGKFQEGIDAYNQVLKYDKFREKTYRTPNEQKSVLDSVVAWNNIGWTYNCMEEFSHAIKACNKAIELKPDFANPYNHKGYAYFKIGHIKEGIKLIEKAIELNPHYPLAFSNLGRVHYELRNYEKAFNACYKCLKIDLQFKKGLSLLRDLINNHELIDISLDQNNSIQDISDPFFKLLRWLRKKYKEKTN